MYTTIPTLLDQLQALKARWDDYLLQSGQDQLTEFALALSSATDLSCDRKLLGVHRLCEELRHKVLALIDDACNHVLNPGDIATIGHHLDAILSAAEASAFPDTDERRLNDVPESTGPGDAKPRDIWLVADEKHPWSDGLIEQLSFFGYRVRRLPWRATPEDAASPLVIIFIPWARYATAEIEGIQAQRKRHPASQIFCLGVPEQLDGMVRLLRAGADVTIPTAQQTTTVLAHLLDLIGAQDQEPYRVLVVEDSPTATAMICRTLSQHGIDNHAINSPEYLLEAVWRYRPDLVLMDMHMPHCTGVEATRVLRQIPACQALPVVYLSSETDMGMQVAALRLGGDQFIGKPFNPVLMSTIVKTKIERYREMQRSSMHDGLTGLLNHTASKMRLTQMLQAMNRERDRLCVVMIDIDRFKSINDEHGHPVGDQVIRNIAWLLKGRLRATDIVGRYGGEEFVVALRGLNIDDAYHVMDRIRRDFFHLPQTHAGGLLHASFSAGIAGYPDFAVEQDLIDAADRALLAAKSGGRNRIVRAG